MPEQEGKNRVCGCKVLMHSLVVLCRTHTIHTQEGQLQVFRSTNTRALYDTRTDGG